jgi:regulator of sirC expression with transglutaminase-like and TPR domain
LRGQPVITDTLRARSIFASLATLDESVFPLDRAAATIALEEYPELEIEACLRQLDAYAAHAQVLLGDDRTPGRVIESLNQVLFVDGGLQGNTEDYYDPRNSYINEVLDRKIGIPITLSVIYIEVARRLGFTFQGVGLPGHFIVRCHGEEGEILIDPFGGGRVLSEANCQDLLDKLFGGTVKLQPAHLQPMDKKAIVTRMLFNLKGIYYHREDYLRALAIVERILMLNPGTPSEIRDRGVLYMQTSLFAAALSDLEYYAANFPGADDASYIDSHIKLLRRIVACTN